MTTNYGVSPSENFMENYGVSPSDTYVEHYVEMVPVNQSRRQPCETIMKTDGSWTFQQHLNISTFAVLLVLTNLYFLLTGLNPSCVLPTWR